jgi:hypothetical protein
MDQNLAVDAVIMWVDGNDPQHKKKRLKALGRDLKTLKSTNENTDDTRFDSLYEIEYCLFSILKHCSWFRRIFIITDEQTPPIEQMVKSYFPDRWKDIVIVDHKEIFKDYEAFLPSFNSSSIESCIWRIEELSDQFVFFNDDFMVLKAMKKTDFFIGPRPVLRGYWKPSMAWRQNLVELKKRIKKGFKPRKSFNISQWKAARLLGRNWRFWFHEHLPYPANKQVLKSYFTTHPTLFEKQISFQFRDEEQFSMIALANNTERRILKNKNRAPLDFLYIKPNGKASYMKEKLKRLKTGDFAFLCVQSLDKATPAQQEALKEILNSKLGR